MKRNLPPQSLDDYIIRLRKANEIVFIDTEVDPYLEIAEITRRVVSSSGPALFFNRVKGSTFPVVTNLYGSKNRLNIAFGENVQERVQTAINFCIEPFPPSIKTLWKKRHDIFTLLRSFRVSKKKLRIIPPKSLSITSSHLNQMPLLTSWKEDGGPFITFPLVYTESPVKPHSKNLGMYRIQRFDDTTTGLHWQIGKGGGYHFFEAEERNQDLPVAIFVGGPPALTLAAIAPLPENVPELLFTSFLLQRPLKMTTIPEHPYPIPNEADFTLLGHAKAHIRKIEGPFGDHFGYLSQAHEFPIFKLQKLYHKKNAIYPATVVGPPPQEDLYIGEFLQTLFKPIFPLVMPSIQDLHTYSESGFHALCAIKIRERYEKEALSSSLRVLGEGQLTLTKILIAIDNNDIDLKDFKSVFIYFLERVRGKEDIIILSHTANDTLDYTGPRLNRGSKAIFIGTGKKPVRILPKEIPSSLPSYIESIAVYCPGCLVITIKSDVELQQIASYPLFSEWPCIIVVDEKASSVIQSQTHFLWSVFTRFEPAQDLYFASTDIVRNMASYQLPMIIDARMKPTYPPVLSVDIDTERLVTKRWKEYFPE